MYPAMNVPQQCSQAMMFAQSGWAQDQMGNSAGAGQYYHQAVQLLVGCQQSGVRLPEHMLFCLGWCQVRLGWLSYLGGNPGWAQQWLQLALPNLEAAWRINPQNPWYQSVLAQTAMMLNRADLVGAICQGSMVPQLEPMRGWLQTTARPASTGPSSGGGNDWLKWLKEGMAVAKECKGLIEAFGKLAGKGTGAGFGMMTGMEGGANLTGMDWMGGDFNTGGWWG